ncbi:MAG: ABC transporter substrate-binding protein [Limnochordia bacterium]
MNKKLMIIAIAVLAVLAVLVVIMRGEKKPTLYVYNWGDYIDESVLDRFEEEYNVRVVYDTFSTNEDMYVKVKSGGSKYDVLFPSDYMIKRMIDEDLLQKINLENVPNDKYIDPMFKGLDHDPNNEYSVPYMWGTLGILYNKNMVSDPVDSWDILWNEKYRKQILMVDSQRDAIGIALQKLGNSLNSTDPAELEAAKHELIKQKELVLAYVVDEAKDKMVAEEAALAVVWSGDAVYAMRENSNLAYAVPKNGGNLWFDGMVIPKTAQNKELAEAFINFMNEPEIALANAEYTGYSTPHMDAREKLSLEGDIEKVAYPNPEDIANAEVFVHIGEMLREYDRIWTEVKAH